MTPAQLADACVAALGAVDGPVAIDAPEAPETTAALRARLAAGADAPRAAVVVFTGEPGDRARRTAALAALHAALPVGAPVVLVDHNQPRRWLGRVTTRLAAPGVSRARREYPAARELQDAGFPVRSLRLLDGERLQLVTATRA